MGKGTAPESANAGAFFPRYSGHKAWVAVADFEAKAANVSTEASAGLRSMFIRMLDETKRFQVAERAATLSPEKTPEVIIAVAVTDFEPQPSGGKSGIGGGGGSSSGALGGLLGANFNNARVSLEVRIVDSATSKVLALRKVSGQASDISSYGGKSFMDNWKLDAGLDAYSNTAMDKAVRISVYEAAKYASQAVPERYYKN